MTSRVQAWAALAARVFNMKWGTSTTVALLAILTGSLSPASASETITYTYDSLGRLVKVDHGATGPNAGVSSTYTYDKAGNRTNVVVAGAGGTTTLTITPTTLPNGTVGTVYSQTVSASGGSGAYTYSLSAGTLPAGLALNSSSGLLSGTPTTAATYAFTVTATDSASHTGNQAYNVTISSGAGTTCSGVSFKVADGSANEGTYLPFSVSKSGTTSDTCTVNYATADGSAKAGTDYSAASGTLTFLPTDTVKRPSISTLDNGVVTAALTMYFNLSSPSGASTISDSQAVGTITDVDGGGGTVCSGIIYSIADAAAVNEGSNLSFTLTKSGSSTATNCSIDYATQDGTAHAGADYTARSGGWTFTSGTSGVTFSVPTIDNGVVTSPLTMYVNLSKAYGGAAISRSQALGTINNTDTGGAASVMASPMSVSPATSTAGAATNRPPVCGDVTVELVDTATSFHVTDSMILNQCSDPDGDALMVTSPATPYDIDVSGGGVVSVVNTVSDGRGGTAQQTINVVRE